MPARAGFKPASARSLRLASLACQPVSTRCSASTRGRLALSLARAAWWLATLLGSATLALTATMRRLSRRTNRPVMAQLALTRRSAPAVRLRRASCSAINRVSTPLTCRMRATRSNQASRVRSPAAPISGRSMMTRQSRRCPVPQSTPTSLLAKCSSAR